VARDRGRADVARPRACRHLDQGGLGTRAELAQAADMVFACADREARCALRARPQAKPVEQMRRRLVTKLGIRLDVQMGVFIAPPVLTAVVKGGINRNVGTRRTLCNLWMAPQMAEKAPEIDIFRALRACEAAIRG
jgi:precorrin isomerase